MFAYNKLCIISNSKRFFQLIIYTSLISERTEIGRWESLWRGRGKRVGGNRAGLNPLYWLLPLSKYLSYKLRIVSSKYIKFFSIVMY